MHINILTRVQGVREFLDEIGHLDGDDDDGEADELDGQFERTVLRPYRGSAKVVVQDTEQEQRLDGQQTGDGGGRHELFHGGDSRCTKACGVYARTRRMATRVGDRDDVASESERDWRRRLFGRKTKVPIILLLPVVLWASYPYRGSGRRRRLARRVLRNGANLEKKKKNKYRTAAPEVGVGRVCCTRATHCTIIGIRDTVRSHSRPLDRCCESSGSSTYRNLYVQVVLYFFR